MDLVSRPLILCAYNVCGRTGRPDQEIRPFQFLRARVVIGQVHVHGATSLLTLVYCLSVGQLVVSLTDYYHPRSLSWPAISGAIPLRRRSRRLLQ
jgi:hypothetical protein